MKELISVIVPIYNSGQYLYGCIKSILQQSYTNFELILIDDGSTDDSQNICLELSKTDKRIIFLLQEHRGVSAARNTGLKKAKGKYLFFVDSDDRIHFQLLEWLHGLMKKTHSQISICRFHYTLSEEVWQFRKDMKCGMPFGYAKESDFEPQSIVTADRNTTELYTYCDNTKALDYFLYGVIKEFFALGGKLILRNAIQDICFDETLQNGEDTKFIYQILKNGADAAVLHQNWYYYRQHEDSLSKVYSVKACQSSYACERYICDQEKEAGRIRNAICRENYIINCISEWYIKSKQIHDLTLLRYVEQLADNEKKLDIYFQSALAKRVRFFLILYCYPLYCCIHRILCLLSKVYKTLKGKFLKSTIGCRIRKGKR